MHLLTRKGLTFAIVLVAALAALTFVAAACGDDDDDGEPTATAEPTGEPTEEPTAAPTEAPTEEPTGDDHGDAITLDAASATITVDGDNADWSAIDGVTVELEQIEIPEGVDWDEPNPLDPIDVTLKVATDSDNIYVLVEVPDDYNFNPDDHAFSPSIAAMFLIDDGAGPHMGAEDEDLELSLGMVDIWHWELDCAAGAASGGGDPGSGDDPDCNLDDEFALDPEDREDDGGGDTANADAENSLAGVWEHTASSDGEDADGTWIFEMSRPLQTGDPEDAQFESGDLALMALAYFDPDESLEGWTDTGHLQSAENGWIEVSIP
jgi:hypothetical protein